MLTLDEAKTHLRLDGSDEDTYIQGLVSVAQEYIEAVITPAPVDGVAQPVPTVTETQRHACRLLVGHWYENREAVSDEAGSEAPLAVRMLLAVNRPPEGLI
jgi:uncharacterized phage protein (predicted DNA packaging)